MLSCLIVRCCPSAIVRPRACRGKKDNIGNGKAARVTGFETLDRGFKMMGRSGTEIFKPEWNAIRNFHCMWFADSHVLNHYLDFQHEGFEDFFARLEKKLWYFKLGKPFPHLIRRFALMPLLRTNNAPAFWVSHNLTNRNQTCISRIKRESKRSVQSSDYVKVSHQ